MSFLLLQISPLSVEWLQIRLLVSICKILLVLKAKSRLDHNIWGTSLRESMLKSSSERHRRKARCRNQSTIQTQCVRIACSGSCIWSQSNWQIKPPLKWSKWKCVQRWTVQLRHDSVQRCCSELEKSLCYLFSSGGNAITDATTLCTWHTWDVAIKHRYNPTLQFSYSTRVKLILTRLYIENFCEIFNCYTCIMTCMYLMRGLYKALYLK